MRDELQTLRKTFGKDPSLQQLKQDNQVNLERRNYNYIGHEAWYEGTWLGGFRHGHGRITFQKGEYYEGEWSFGYAHGQGRFQLGLGESYEGGWSYSMRKGIGKQIHTNQIEFEGQWDQNKRNGIGIERFMQQGEFFMGKFKNGKRNGFGFYQHKDQCVFLGNYKDDMMEGFGLFTWPNGKIFKGSFINQKIDGFGEQSYPDGRRYKGFYKADKKHGYGVYEGGNEQKNKYYEGGWFENNRHGYGRIRHKDQKQADKYILYVEGKKIIQMSDQSAMQINSGGEELDWENPNLVKLIQASKPDVDIKSLQRQTLSITKTFDPPDSLVFEKSKFYLDCELLLKQMTNFHAKWCQLFGEPPESFVKAALNAEQILKRANENKSFAEDSDSELSQDTPETVLDEDVRINMLPRSVTGSYEGHARCTLTQSQFTAATGSTQATSMIYQSYDSKK